MLQVTLMQSTDMSKVDICSKHGGYVHIKRFIDWLSHHEVEVMALAWLQKTRNAFQVTQVDHIKDSIGSPIVFRCVYYVDLRMLPVLVMAPCYFFTGSRHLHSWSWWPKQALKVKPWCFPNPNQVALCLNLSIHTPEYTHSFVTVEKQKIQPSDWHKEMSSFILSVVLQKLGSYTYTKEQFRVPLNWNWSKHTSRQTITNLHTVE